ncbi:serpin family protein [Streptomyces sp. NBC_01622]|uniref:serpin family protein n=1 Tax=Streptomyces sp. NBC_01622 TaxID=2975903 RepID=UPI00386968B7
MGERVAKTTVRAVNALTARWAGAACGGTVFSAAGVWPLLAFLADGASGDARAELADAVGLPADHAATAARELLAATGSMPGLRSALGLWTRHELAVREEWRAGLPAGTHGVLTDVLPAGQRALDAWAAERTGGLIERMPVALDADVVMVPASALALRTEWPRPFDELMLSPDAGPWQGRRLAGLRRTGVRLDRAGVTSGPHGYVTELKVPGDNGIDVHLLLGEQRMPPPARCWARVSPPWAAGSPWCPAANSRTATWDRACGSSNSGASYRGRRSCP